MFTSIAQVNEQFFKEFFKLKIMKDSELFTVPLRYARKSAEDYSEEDFQSYPCIVIQDHEPIPKDGWYVDVRDYAGEINSVDETVEMVRKPLWMEFIYDVSIATKSYLDSMALKKVFLDKFQRELNFVFINDTEEDVVTYSVKSVDIPRVDGVLETNYEFRLTVWLYTETGVTVSIIKDVNITLEQNKL